MNHHLRFWILLGILFSGSAFCQTEKPIVLGHSIEINSKILNESRVLNIYLPEGYNAADTIRYPVIYLLDGSLDEDFIHVAGLVQFCTFEWVNYLPPSIVVGIGTVDRRRDFTFPTTVNAEKSKFPTSGGSHAFLSFLENELQPFVLSRFKTTNHKTLIGQSFGALLVTEALVTRPQLCTDYIIISPSLWWDNGSLLNRSFDRLKKTDLQQTSIFVAVGKEGLTPSGPPRLMEEDAMLLVEKLKAVQNPNVRV